MLVKLKKSLLMFVLGGSIYTLAEMVWRYFRGSAPTQWVMFVIGGIAMVVIDSMNTNTRDRLSLSSQVFALTFEMTVLEFVSGLIVNVWLKMNVWDYSQQAYNIFGQVCLPYIGLWAVLVLCAILLDDVLLYRVFGYSKRRYFKEERNG